MKKIKLMLVWGACFVLAFVGIHLSIAKAAAVAGAAPEDGAVMTLLKTIYDAFAHGQRAYAGAITLVLVVALVKRYVAPRVAFLQHDIAGSVMTMVAAFGATFGAALGGGASASWAIAKNALEAAVLAGGGYSLLKPIVVWLAEKAPAWAQPFLAVVLWIFNKPVDDAKKAGDAAVAANPPGGASSVVGEPKDVP